MSRLTRSARTLLAVVLGGALAASLAACTPSVALKSAAHANDPACAAVEVRLPDTIAGHKRDNTNAQSTAAWGSPVVAQLSCGVAPLGPTTKPCVTIKTDSGAVDWVLENDPEDITLQYITFGRTPAVTVSIKGVVDADVLNGLAQAVQQLPVDRSLKCVGASDAP